MNPSQPTNQFAPKWRQYHPQSIVWVQNPFDHDVVFQVADEHNVPYTYKIAARATAELPGGAVATLGVKTIIDELIQNSSKDMLSIWSETVRAKYEADVVIRVKEASNRTTKVSEGGEIDLSIKGDSESDESTPAPAETVETPFPALNASPETESADEVASIAATSASKLQASSIIETD